MGGFELDLKGGWERADTPRNRPKEAKKSHRRVTECLEFSTQYEYRRAFSELHLIDALDGRGLEVGKSYAFITGGDVDALSYLKLVLRHYPKVEHLIASTWCIGAEDILQLRKWVEDGTIGRLDMYVGEIFPGQYKVEWAMLKSMYNDLRCGRLAYFRYHSKVFAGVAQGVDFAIQTSANINTNPRTEQGIISVGVGLYDFYRQYFDGINSFNDGE